MVKIKIQSLDGGLWECELLVRWNIMLCCYEFPPSFNLDSFFASFGKHYSEIARPPRRGHHMPPCQQTEKPLTQRSFICTARILEMKPFRHLAAVCAAARILLESGEYSTFNDPLVYTFYRILDTCYCCCRCCCRYCCKLDRTYASANLYSYLFLDFLNLRHLET